MRTRGPWRDIFLFLGLFLLTAGALRAEEKVAAKAAEGSSDELESGSQASVDDGMSKSRFGEDEDDSYTDDSDSLDDLNKSKFKDEKNDDQETDEEDNS